MSTIDPPGAAPSPALEQLKPEKSENRQLLSSTTAMIVGRLSTAALGWAGSVIIARTLTGDDWGRYSFVFALLGILEVVTDLGVGRVVLARLNSSKAAEVSRIAGSFIVLRALLGVIGYLLAVGYAYFTGLSPLVVAAAALAGTTVVLATPANAFFVLYQSKLRLTYIAVWDILGQVVQFLLILLVAAFSPTLLWFLFPAIIREVVVFVGRGIGIPQIYEKDFRPSFRTPFAHWGEMLREALPISIGFALITALERIDMLMLQRLDTFEAVGLYAIGYKFSDLLGLVVGALAVPFTTVLVRAWPHHPAEFQSRVFQPLAVATLLSGLAIVLFWPASESVITLLYGQEFIGSANAAALMVTAAGLGGLTFVVITALVSAKKLRVFPWIALAGLFMNIGFNIVLIPLFSINGAALATVGTQAVMLVAMLVLLRFSLKIPGVSPWGLLIRQTLIITAVAVPARMLAADLGFPWISVTIGAGVSYLLLAALAERHGSAILWAQLRRASGRNLSSHAENQ
ncbi:flippase [Corynebacterium sp. A21]|uniref:flippase n=1 Tax=Corynebacterium sp. A21 TaxID=3457318 RepID=UPI003FD4E92C